MLPVSELNGRSFRPVFVQSLFVVSRCALLASIEPEADFYIVQLRNGWDCLLDFRRNLLGCFRDWIIGNPERLQFFQRFAEVRDYGLITDLVVY